MGHKSSNDVPLYAGKPLPVLVEPVSLKSQDSLLIESSLTEILKQVEDFTTQALKDKTILKLLGVPDDLDPTPTPLGLHIPFARFDFTFDGKDINVLELNTDGTSGFNVTEWLAEKAGLKKSENPNHGLSDKLLEALRAHAPEAPHIAMVDFSAVNTRWEQEDLIKRWKKKTSCELADPSVRSWKPNSLIYRRALSWQLRSRADQAKAFLDDWKARNVTVVGGWSSDVGMSKVWPALLKTKHSPDTRLLTDKLATQILGEREEWVLKGALSYSGNSVIRGQDTPQARWEAAVKQVLAETKAGRPWIAQRKVELPLYENKPMELGLFFLNGEPSGYMCRWGHSQAISDSSEEVLRPVRIIS